MPVSNTIPRGGFAQHGELLHGLKARGVVTHSPARPYAAFAFYRPDENRMRSFPAVRAIAVAGMVRSLTGTMARQTGHGDPDSDPDQWVKDYAMGHGEADGMRARFSYLPLPTIRPPNVLGDIRRVIVAEPPGGTGVHAAWASQTLRGQILLSEQQREEALLMPLASGDAVLRHYVAPSESWATVTPLVLPGSDEGKLAKAEKLFVKALGHAGYAPEALADLEFRAVAFWPGGELALKYQRPDYFKRDHWSVYHARVRWHHPGPPGHRRRPALRARGVCCSWLTSARLLAAFYHARSHVVKTSAGLFCLHAL